MSSWKRLLEASSAVEALLPCHRDHQNLGDALDCCKCGRPEIAVLTSEENITKQLPCQLGHKTLYDETNCDECLTNGYFSAEDKTGFEYKQ